jgi:hypothetical protein
MMAKQAKDRYQTPAELLEDLNNPGIARSGLNADVLAALAAPGTRPPESSSGDIGTRRGGQHSEAGRVADGGRFRRGHRRRRSW